MIYLHKLAVNNVSIQLYKLATLKLKIFCTAGVFHQVLNISKYLTFFLFNFTFVFITNLVLMEEKPYSLITIIAWFISSVGNIRPGGWVRPLKGF